jgi:Haem-degrading
VLWRARIRPPRGGQPAFIQALSVALGDRIVPVPGGVLIRDQEGEIAGAVGISGDTSENDETCAVYAIGCAGLPSPSGLAGRSLRAAALWPGHC